MTELLEFAQTIAQSALVPSHYRNKPADIVVAVQMGYDVGVTPMQALQHIYVLQGKPSMSGELMTALIRGSAKCEWLMFEYSNDTAICRAKRRDEAIEHETRFSIDDAKRAKLITKENWLSYPEDMCTWRALSRMAKRVFPDVTRGLLVYEEVQDYHEAVDVTESFESHLGEVETDAMPVLTEHGVDKKTGEWFVKTVGAQKALNALRVCWAESNPVGTLPNFLKWVKASKVSIENTSEIRAAAGRWADELTAKD